MSTSSPVRASVMEEYGSDDDDLRRAIAESLLLSASPAIPLGFLGVNEVDESSRLHYESRSESSSSTAHHVGDAGEDDISLHQSTISMTSVEESEESSEKFFAERLLASEDFMKKVRTVECQSLLYIQVVLANVRIPSDIIAFGCRNCEPSLLE